MQSQISINEKPFTLLELICCIFGAHYVIHTKAFPVALGQKSSVSKHMLVTSCYYAQRLAFEIYVVVLMSNAPFYLKLACFDASARFIKLLKQTVPPD